MSKQINGHIISEQLVATILAGLLSKDGTLIGKEYRDRQVEIAYDYALRIHSYKDKLEHKSCPSANHDKEEE